MPRGPLCSEGWGEARVEVCHRVFSGEGDNFLLTWLLLGCIWLQQNSTWLTVAPVTPIAGSLFKKWKNVEWKAGVVTADCNLHLSTLINSIYICSVLCRSFCNVWLYLNGTGNLDLGQQTNQPTKEICKTNHFLTQCSCPGSCPNLSFVSLTMTNSPFRWLQWKARMQNLFFLKQNIILPWTFKCEITHFPWFLFRTLLVMGLKLKFGGVSGKSGNHLRWFTFSFVSKLFTFIF